MVGQLSRIPGTFETMSEASILGIEVSAMRPDDLAFVASGWKRSHHNAPQNEAEPASSYFARMNRVVDELLSRPGVTVLVARSEEHPDVLLGFVCVEQRGRVLALHYAYTRGGVYRKMGVCRRLLKRALDSSPSVEVLVYTAGSRFDELWERWGFERADLDRWMQGAAA